MWSPQSNDLTGLRLSATLEGETSPPSLQATLSDEEALRKKALIHDDAISTVKNHWEGKCYDGFPVHAVAIPCMSKQKDALLEKQELLVSFTATGVGVLSSATTSKNLQNE